MDKQLHPDAPLIADLGGPTKVAKLLGFTPQRVQNWLERGIPPAIKVKRPDLFIPGVKVVRAKFRAPEERQEMIRPEATQA